MKLDVTNPADAEAAVKAAVECFGRIDVLVNNAGNFYAGFFEEITPEDFRAQVETNLFGPVNVTRAVLPVMRTFSCYLPEFVKVHINNARVRRTAYSESGFVVPSPTRS